VFKVTLLFKVTQVYRYSFIHSGHFYSASSSQLLLRSTPDTAWILCRSFTPNCHRRVKDFPKLPMWRPERDSNPRSGRRASTQPMHHHVPLLPGVRMEQKSPSEFLSWKGFEPRTSYLVVQHAKFVVKLDVWDLPKPTCRNCTRKGILFSNF